MRRIIMVGSLLCTVLLLMGALQALAAPGPKAAPRNARAGSGGAASLEACLACARATDPRDCHRLALRLAEAHDWGNAVAIEEKVHAQLPNEPEVAAALGRMHQFGTKDVARATEMYHAALAAAPGYPPALFGLGTLMQEHGKTEIAARYFARGAKERPEMALFKVRLAETLVELGREKEARPLLEEVVQRFPGTPEADAAGRMMNQPALARP